jgi:calcium-translocating P-type ATPase
MSHFFALLLWGAVVLALIAGMPMLSIAIGIVVVINGVFAFVQEYRADRAAERLRDLMPASCLVRRDGRVASVPAADLVVGDLLVLTAGNQVSADADLAVAHSLAVDESLLTGESRPRHIDTDSSGARVYAGTFVVEGVGEAVVTATGANTRLAQIAALTQQTHRPPSPLALRLHRVIVIIGAIALGVGAMFYVIAMALGLGAARGFVMALGVTVALVPEGLLPTVTLSLAWGARQMAARSALVKRLESVETLGSVTFICTDKTGTLTRNEMSAAAVWTPGGVAAVTGIGYEPAGVVSASAAVRQAVAELAMVAAGTSTAHTSQADRVWRPVGDPTEVALYVLAQRCGADPDTVVNVTARRFPFDHRRLRSSAVISGVACVKGAPEAIIAACRAGEPTAAAAAWASEMNHAGMRTIAVASKSGVINGVPIDQVERDLDLLGVVALVDPARDDVAAVIEACRAGGIKLAMLTGDHPGTAAAVARQVGLMGPDQIVLLGADLPAGDEELADVLDRDGVVVARVRPEDKLRVTKALQARGHVVAMTGDGVNDAPALRAADIGVAMGASGTDVAREAADLVLLDDHFATIVAAIELGRATFANIRRFLTYHLTDNVSELAPFLLWALTGGAFPLAIGVLQILALDIGTDLLPALALGAEPARPDSLRHRASAGQLLDRRVLGRAFGLLGPTEVVVSMAAYAAVLLHGGWRWGEIPAAGLQTAASGTAFAAIVLGQMATALACRSESWPMWRWPYGRNSLLLGAILAELGLLLVFVGVPAVASALGGGWPPWFGWLLAGLAIPLVLAVDAGFKVWHRRHPGLMPRPAGSTGPALTAATRSG